MRVVDKGTGVAATRDVTLGSDEGARPDTTLEGLASLRPVLDAGIVTAGNASQLSDGASCSVLMEAAVAERRGLAPLGRYVGLAVAGTAPDEMGIGPVFAVPRVSERFGLRMDDIDLRERNEAFAVQVLYCQDRLAIPDERLHVNGGAIHRPSLRQVGRADVGPRLDRGVPPGREAGRGDDVRRRRHGCRRSVRGAGAGRGPHPGGRRGHPTRPPALAPGRDFRSRRCLLADSPVEP